MTLNKDIKKDLVDFIKRQDNNFFLESKRSDNSESSHNHHAQIEHDSSVVLG